MTQEQIAVFIPIVAIVGSSAIGGLALLFAYKRRELRHRERMVAIEKGIDVPPESTPDRSALALLLRGLTWLFVGAAIVLFFVVVSLAEKNSKTLPAAVLGLIPAGVGIAHLIVYRVRCQQEQAAAASENLKASR